jgi:hypothetical protein
LNEPWNTTYVTHIRKLNITDFMEDRNQWLQRWKQVSKKGTKIIERSEMPTRNFYITNQFFIIIIIIIIITKHFLV